MSASTGFSSATTTTVGKHHLLCQVGSHLVALPVPVVLETMRPLPVEPLAGLPDFVLGLSVIRSLAVPVVAGAKLLGCAGAPIAGRFVTLKTGEGVVALAVDDVLKIIRLDDADRVNLPPLLREFEAPVLEAISVLDAKLLLVLDTARLVPAEVWSQIKTGHVP